jgi:SAM-dependent methyltransferase
LKKYYEYLHDTKKFKALSKNQESRFEIKWKNRYPCLHEKTTQTYFDRHYVYHTGWAARVLAKTKPKKHVDISSSLYFASIASAFVPIEFYDYRPAKIELENLSTNHADLLKLQFEDESIKSLSCMHVIEHIGLGRYGDPLDPSGDLKAISELKRVLKSGGNLLFVVPVGKPKIMFNAHRIYSYDQIISYFPKLKLKQFALIAENPSDGEILYSPQKSIVEKQKYGCGCFWFEK